MTVIWRRRNVWKSAWWPDAYSAPRYIKLSLRKKNNCISIIMQTFVKLSSGISYFVENSNVAQCLPNLWNFVFCKCAQMPIISEHLPKVGLDAILKSSLSVRSKHLSKWTSWLQCCHFLYMGLFYLFFAFLWLCVCIVCNDCNAVCYQYSLWHYDIKPIHVNLKLVPVSSKGTCVFWICKVITENKSTLVQQMAWCRQAKNITSLPEPHTRTHTQIPLLLVITYLRICSTPQGPMV